ncbi:hypothetical protein F4703DRAFT_1486998 [Phycomyces blakesleeanus]
MPYLVLLVPIVFVLYAATHSKLYLLLCHSPHDNGAPFGHFLSLTHLIIYGIELSSIPSHSKSPSTTMPLHYLTL